MYCGLSVGLRTRLFKKKKALADLPFQGDRLFGATLDVTGGGRVPFFHSLKRGRSLVADVALPSQHTPFFHPSGSNDKGSKSFKPSSGGSK